MEQNTFMVMTYFRSGTQNEFGNWNYSTEFCYDRFMGMYPDIQIAFQVFTQHCKPVVPKKKSTGRPTSIVTEQALYNVKERM